MNNGTPVDPMDRSAGGPARPLPAWLARNGAWLLPPAAYVLSWATWAPLLGREITGAAGLPIDFLVLALAGNVMPAIAVLAWHLIGGRVPGSARAGLPTPRLLPFMAGALAVVPAMTLVAIGIQVAFGMSFSFNDIASRLPIGLAWPMVAALGEEFLWRGTLLPLLRERVGLLKAALIIGLVWGFWHLPPDWIGLKFQGAWFWPQFLLQGPVLLTAHSVIMAWLWARSGGRTFAAILYHFGITGSAIVLGNQAALAPSLSLAGNTVGAAVVVVVALAAGISLARENRA